MQSFERVKSEKHAISDKEGVLLKTLTFLNELNNNFETKKFYVHMKLP